MPYNITEMAYLQSILYNLSTMKSSLRAIFFSLLALFFVASLVRSILSYQDKVQFYHDLQAEYEKENALNKKLKSDARKGSDYYYVEKQIREKLNLLKESETSVIIPSLTPSPSPTLKIQKSPHMQWLDLVLGRSGA